MNDTQIQLMVDRFLGWQLPDDFAPDAGISFRAPPMRSQWPVGTNLLTASQAEALVRHLVAGFEDLVVAEPARAGHDTVADSDGDDGA